MFPDSIFLEGSQASPICTSGKRITYMKMSMEYWWNDNDREKPKYSDKNLSECYFVHHKSHMAWPAIEPAPPK